MAKLSACELQFGATGNAYTQGRGAGVNFGATYFLLEPILVSEIVTATW
jgi:hypothetical protein